jgi:hypothetical protein
MKTIEQLKEQAEQERVSGHREKFLKLKEQIEQAEHNFLLEMHKQRVEEAKKEFPVGFYIPELHSKVTEIKDGCGTQKGWVDIYLGEKHYSVGELHRKINKAKETKEASDFFDHLKFSNKGKLYVGRTYCETLNMFILAMGLDIWTSEEMDENNFGSFYGSYDSAYKQAIDDGYTDEEAEEKGREAEDEEYSSLFKEYTASVERTIRYLLNFHELDLVENKNKYYIEPHISWEKSAALVKETINGYGTFYFETVKEFKECGPYKNYCEAVIQHIHWLKYYPEVYGARGYQSVYER